MRASETREAIVRIVAAQSGVAPAALRDDTRIVEDLHLDGDDVVEIVEAVAKTFSVDMANYRWYHHHGPEGCNPLWIIFPPWWTRKKHIPIRIADLIEAARTGAWPIAYPDSDREM